MILLVFYIIETSLLALTFLLIMFPDVRTKPDADVIIIILAIQRYVKIIKNHTNIRFIYNIIAIAIYNLNWFLS